MNAELTQPCTCELCQPNWYLGRDDSFEAQPAEAPARQVTLAEVHARKMAKLMVGAPGVNAMAN